MFWVRSSTMCIAKRQVSRVATNAIPAPTAIGRWYRRLGPTILAVIAASTRIHSSPSRKTSTLISSTTAVWSGGAGAASTDAAHDETSTPMTKATAAHEAMRTAGGREQNDISGTPCHN